MRGTESMSSHCVLSAVEALEARQFLSVTTPVDPTINLTDTVKFLSPKTLQVKPGHFATISVEIFNTGNSLARPSIPIELEISADGDGSSPAFSETVVRPIHIVSSGHQIVNINVKLPLTFVPGTYFAGATVDPTNVLNETTIADNSAVSTNELTVQSLYANLLGVFSGPERILRGTGKGGTLTHVDDFTSENDVTGAFSGTGTNYYSNGTVEGTFTFTGTITATGVFSDEAFATPANNLGPSIAHGHLVKNRLVLTFRTDFNSGTLSLIEEL